jgi:hypothetical protein
MVEEVMSHELMAVNDEEQQWRKHLRAHDRTLLAAIVAVLVGYFAALIGAIHWSLHVLKSTGHWKP